MKKSSMLGLLGVSIFLVIFMTFFGFSVMAFFDEWLALDRHLKSSPELHLNVSFPLFVTSFILIILTAIVVFHLFRLLIRIRHL